MSSSFSLINETAEKLPFIDFTGIKKAVLGQDYSLNLIIALPESLKKLNTIYRDKEEATDILSFPLSETEGEIYICPEEARKEAVKFGRTYENFLAFLFIHGCVHLKGYDHGKEMEKEEEKIRMIFGI